MLGLHLGLLTQLVAAAFAAPILFVLWKLAVNLILPSPLDDLRGPPSKSWLTGNMKDWFNRHAWNFVDNLANEYGPASKLHGWAGTRILHVFDPTALHHIILKDSHAYDETKWFYEGNNLLFGPGLLSTHGDHHRKQRKMLNPVFSIKHMRHMTSIFYRIAHKLRDGIMKDVQDAPKDVNILEWMGRTALELIGQGGLGYSFDPLVETGSNPFGDALKAFLPALFSVGALRFLTPYLKYLGSPSFRRFLMKTLPLPELQKLSAIVDWVDRESRQVYELKKQALLSGDEALLEQVGEGKDIMSILLKANMLAPEDDRLPEEELIGQISTLVFAATDTTSTALTQILHTLAEHPEAQEKLREEIREASKLGGGDIPYDQLVSLPYMDAVCRETLRLHPPVTFVFREVVQNAVLPFSEPILGRNGKLLNEIALPKGTPILIQIRAINRNKALWGEDALEWKPERWLSTLPKTVTEARIPGVYSNLMTFLGGGRACIGFKFSQLEMKVVLSTLISSFKISMPANGKDIIWNMAGVRYPTVGESVKPAFPMRMERLVDADSEFKSQDE